MKRIVLALLCVLALLLAGCTDINQNNSFVGQPTAEPATQTQIPETPEATQPPAATTDLGPADTFEPMGTQQVIPENVMLQVQETLPPATSAPTNGFNG